MTERDGRRQGKTWDRRAADLSIDFSLLSRDKINLLASQLTTHLSASNQNFIRSFLWHWKVILKFSYTWNTSESNKTAEQTGSVIISVIRIQGKAKERHSSFNLPFPALHYHSWDCAQHRRHTNTEPSESNCVLCEPCQMKRINTIEITFEYAAQK